MLLLQQSVYLAVIDSVCAEHWRSGERSCPFKAWKCIPSTTPDHSVKNRHLDEQRL